MPAPDEATMRAWSALLVAHRRLTTEMDRELRDRTGMDLDEYDVLYQLHAAGRPVRMGELADRVLITRPTVTRLVGRLVDQGLVERTGDAEDRRTVRVSLSQAGRARLAEAAVVHGDGIARLVGGPLDGHDAAALAAALESLAPSTP
ncbi:MAG: MarR family transcriptional regulator [Actinomycetota bacterium]|nr:MarR family transcriptional regulator [Actinomycetota bacterium]